MFSAVLLPCERYIIQEYILIKPMTSSVLKNMTFVLFSAHISAPDSPNPEAPLLPH